MNTKKKDNAVPKGKLLIIGGKEDRDGTDVEMKHRNKEFIPHEILKLLLKNKTDRIEVITTASSEPESMRETYAKTFKEIGYTNFGFIHFADKAEHEYLERIRKSKVVFFTGGDQKRICDEIRNTEICDILAEKYFNEENFIIAGTSAGAMCMPEIIICEAEKDEAILENDIRISSGLGFLSGCIVDTHFVHRGRFGRLAHAIMLHRECFGIGLGEDTALLIEEGKKAICKGSGMVIAISGKEIGKTNIETVEDGHPVYGENIKAHIITDGCSINLESGEFNAP
ncbi:cyanophycinase [Chryseobacterium profundimaris]|uniref:Cyanophycinase n=1 Tax=Chryseobacterium profundimaris TaxID=1387275 RepID=A0ABY1PJ95_9FLAO|nr:cyanophycinase [Chryseobacterium profundimaris]SMP35284.1 cyanophycinase [Chryseobacterium profundimaris]